MEPSRNHILKIFLRSTRIFITITLFTLFSILLLTVERETLRALMELNFFALLALLTVWVLYVYTDALRFKLILSTNGLSNNLSMSKIFETIFIGYFFASITPFQTGGLPFQVLHLRKLGIKPGRAALYLSLRGLLIYIPLFFISPFLFYVFSFAIENQIIRILINYLVTLILSVGIVIGVFALFPRIFMSMYMKIHRKIPSFLKKPIDLIFNEFEEFKLALYDLWRVSKKRLILIISYSLISLFLYLSITPVIYITMGGEVKYFFVIIAYHAMLMVLFLFAPTPGAGAIAEMGGLILFSTIIPKHILGVFVILWRFFTFYLLALIGGIVALKEFGK